jgi:peptidoglycan/xylan/chitin deacetylase (PgdA/CDA1 family)
MFVLNFHGLGEPARPLADGEADVWLDRAQFCEILDVIRQHRDVQITFDDGNSSDMHVALPELERRGQHASFFICAGRLNAAEFLSQDIVRSLHSAGMSIGSHGMNHVRWRKLKEHDLQREIVQAKRVIEETINASIDAAACPFGDYDRKSLQALREAGFSRVCTSDGGPAHPNDWLIARNTVHRWDTAATIERLLSDGRDAPRFTQRAKRLIKQWR